MEKGKIKNERVQRRLDRWFDTLGASTLHVPSPTREATPLARENPLSSAAHGIQVLLRKHARHHPPGRLSGRLPRC